MSLELENLLLEKPVTLCYWDLTHPYERLKVFFEKKTEWRMLNHFQEILEWINYGDVENLVVGIGNPENILNFKQFLDRIPLEKRREIFVILISPKLQTLDPKESFIYSVNLVVNTADLNEFERVYLKARQYWERLYRPYRSSLEKLKEVLS